jgi:hypothetical protein
LASRGVCWQGLRQHLHIQPVRRAGVEGDGQVVGQQADMAARAAVLLQRLADAPQRLAQVVAGVGFAGIWPQQTGQLLPAESLARVQAEIGQQRLRRPRGQADRFAVQVKRKLAQETKFVHGFTQDLLHLVRTEAPQL